MAIIPIITVIVMYIALNGHQLTSCQSTVSDDHLKQIDAQPCVDESTLEHIVTMVTATISKQQHQQQQDDAGLRADNILGHMRNMTGDLMQQAEARFERIISDKLAEHQTRMEDIIQQELGKLRMSMDQMRRQQLQQQNRKQLTEDVEMFDSENDNTSMTTTPRSDVMTRPTEPSSVNRSLRLASIVLNRTLSEGVCAYGVASTSNRLFVNHAHEPHLEVYDSPSLDWVENMTIAGLGCINDMASCLACDVLYVVDACNRVIHAIDEHGVRLQWPVDDLPNSASVTLRMNVVVTFDEARELREYTPNGRLVRVIALPSDIANPKHAVEVADGLYAVSHGRPTAVPGQQVHRVCVVGSNGTIVRSFGGVRGAGIGQLDTPIHLGVFGGSMLVADLNNFRVLLLREESLAFVRVLVSTREDVFAPARMALGEDGRRLYVSYQLSKLGNCESGHVKVFNLNWI